MAPYDGGPTVWKKEYEKVAQKFMAQFELPEMDVFARDVSNDRFDPKWFEIVCNDQISRDFDALLSAVNAFRDVCTPFADLKVSGLRMQGKAEWDGGMFSDDASYQACVAFEGAQKVNRWAGHHHRIAKQAFLLSGKGVEEVAYTPRRMNDREQKLITRPQFVAM